MNDKSKIARKTKDPFYYRHKNFFVGIFVLIPLLLLPGLLIFALVKSEVMEKWLDLYVCSETGTGLKKGTPVNILGIKVGHVHTVTLNDKGYVDIALKVKCRYAHFLHEDSKAKLKQKSFVVGDWEFDLTVGSDSYPPVKNGDTLEVEYSIRIDKIYEQFTKMAEPIEEILQGMKSGEGILNTIFGSDTLMAGTKDMMKKVDKLFIDVGSTIDNADKMIDKLSSFGQHGTATVDSFLLLFEGFERLIYRIDGVVLNVDSLIEGFDSAPNDLDSIFTLLQKDLREAEVLLKGIQNHWFLRRSMRKQRELDEKEEIK